MSSCSVLSASRPTHGHFYHAYVLETIRSDDMASNGEPSGAPSHHNDISPVDAPQPAVSQPAAAHPPQPRSNEKGYYAAALPQQGPGPYAQYPQSYGMPFQPYQQPQIMVHPQPMIAQPYPETLPQPEENRRQLIGYIVAHSVLIVFSLCDIGLSLSLLKYGTYNDAALVALCTIVVPGMALLWSASELITRAVRSNHVGIHPGAHVGVLLLIWLGAAIVGGIGATYVAFMNVYDDYRSGSCWNDSTFSYEECDHDDEKEYAHSRNILIATVAFKFLVLVISFALFVRACIDTHRKNRAGRQVVFIQAPYWPGPAAQGWQQMPNMQGPVPQGNHAQHTQNIPIQTRNSTQPQPSTQGAGEVQSPQPAVMHEYYTPTSHHAPGTAA